MQRGSLVLGLCVATCLTLVLIAVPPALATSPTYSTSSIVKSAMVQTKISGYEGVLVNYTSSFPTSTNGFVYMDLTNSAGETVAWNVGSCEFAPAATAQCFVLIPQSVSTGTYSASVFVVTSTGV